MKVVVFSNSSFSNASVRLGLQIMASQLAERGHEVDYLSVPTHPLELLAPMRRSSCIHAWFKRGDRSPVSVSDRLREYSLRTPFSRSRRYWWFENQTRLYSMFSPSWMNSRRYDACIRDTAMSGLFADKVQASVRVLRLNDNPDGLLDDVHPMVVRRLKHQINARHFDEVWPVSGTMLSAIEGIDTSIPAVKDSQRRVPRALRCSARAGRANSVCGLRRHLQSLVRCGSPEPGGTPAPGLANRSLWTVQEEAPSSACATEHRLLWPTALRPGAGNPLEVSSGLVPFAGGKAILETMDPLKANQYLAAGLGIASTSHGSLRKALHGLAHFGDDPSSFAAATRNADRDCGVLRERDEVKRHLRRVTWSAIMDLVEDRLHCLLGSREADLR